MGPGWFSGCFKDGDSDVAHSESLVPQCPNERLYLAATETFFAPIHLRLLTRRSFETDHRLGGTRRMQLRDEAGYCAVGSVETHRPASLGMQLRGRKAGRSRALDPTTHLVLVRRESGRTPTGHGLGRLGAPSPRKYLRTILDEILSSHTIARTSIPRCHIPGPHCCRLRHHRFSGSVEQPGRQ